MKNISWMQKKRQKKDKKDERRKTNFKTITNL